MLFTHLVVWTVNGDGNSYLYLQYSKQKFPDSNHEYEYIGQVDIWTFSNYSDVSPYSEFTRMRVFMKYKDYPELYNEFSYGEVEDYTVNIN